MVITCVFYIQMLRMISQVQVQAYSEIITIYTTAHWSSYVQQLTTPDNGIETGVK